MKWKKCAAACGHVTPKSGDRTKSSKQLLVVAEFEVWCSMVAIFSSFERDLCENVFNRHLIAILRKHLYFGISKARDVYFFKLYGL